MTDQELVQAYLDCNNHAFDELLARNQNNIFGYIIKVVEDEELANELFQETFLKIISKLQNHQYTETGRLQWWMLRVAHNVVIDYYRDQKKIFVVDAPKENDLSAVKSDELVDVNRENELTNQRTLKQLVLLMNALPAPQREVVYMRYFQDMSFKEIAEEVGCSINTSLGRMHYALINMRKLSRQYNINLCLE
jgi:RNA polymerase sigma-70 factor (ECF subfamily)